MLPFMTKDNSEDRALSPDVGAARPKGRAESYRKLFIGLET